MCLWWFNYNGRWKNAAGEFQLQVIVFISNCIQLWLSGTVNNYNYYPYNSAREFAMHRFHSLSRFYYEEMAGNDVSYAIRIVWRRPSNSEVWTVNRRNILGVLQVNEYILWRLECSFSSDPAMRSCSMRLNNTRIDNETVSLRLPHCYSVSWRAELFNSQITECIYQYIEPLFHTLLPLFIRVQAEINFAVHANLPFPLNTSLIVYPFEYVARIFTVFACC